MWSDFKATVWLTLSLFWMFLLHLGLKSCRNPSWNTITREKSCRGEVFASSGPVFDDAFRERRKQGFAAGGEETLPFFHSEREMIKKTLELRMSQCLLRLLCGLFDASVCKGKTELDHFSKTSGVCVFSLRAEICRKYLYAYKQKRLSGGSVWVWEAGSVQEIFIILQKKASP